MLYSGGGGKQRAPVVMWVTSLGFDKAYHRGGILKGVRCDIMGVIQWMEKSLASTLEAGTVCCGTLAHLWVLRAINSSRPSITHKVVSWGCHSDNWS